MYDLHVYIYIYIYTHTYECDIQPSWHPSCIDDCIFIWFFYRVFIIYISNFEEKNIFLIIFNCTTHHPLKKNKIGYSDISSELTLAIFGF